MSFFIIINLAQKIKDTFSLTNYGVKGGGVTFFTTYRDNFRTKLNFLAGKISAQDK